MKRIKVFFIITLTLLFLTIIFEYRLTIVSANLKEEFFIENWYVQVETDPASYDHFFILSLLDQKSIENESYFDANIIFILMYEGEFSLSVRWNNKLESTMMTWIIDGKEVVYDHWTLAEDVNTLFYSSEKIKIMNLIYELSEAENLSIIVETNKGEEKRIFKPSGLKYVLSYIFAQ